MSCWIVTSKRRKKVKPHSGENGRWIFLSKNLRLGTTCVVCIFLSPYYLLFILFFLDHFNEFSFIWQKRKNSNAESFTLPAISEFESVVNWLVCHRLKETQNTTATGTNIRTQYSPHGGQKQREQER